MSDPRLKEVERVIELTSQGRGKEALAILDELIAGSSHPDDLAQLNLLAADAASEIEDLAEVHRRLQLAEDQLPKAVPQEIHLGFHYGMFRYLVQIGDLNGARQSAQHIWHTYAEYLEKPEYRSIHAEIDLLLNRPQRSLQ